MIKKLDLSKLNGKVFEKFSVWWWMKLETYLSYGTNVETKKNTEEGKISHRLLRIMMFPEVLVQKLRTNTMNQNQCPLPTGPWSEQAGNLPKCWFPDDGGKSCVMTCDTANILHLPVRCDLNFCSNLRLTNENTRFECVDTGETCRGHS